MNSLRKRLFHRHPGKSLLAFVFGTSLLLILLTEGLLRLAGFEPGYTRPGMHFTFVDSLIIHREYVADQNGIHKVDPSLSDSLHSLLESFSSEPKQLFSLQSKLNFKELIAEFALLQFSETEIDSFKNYRLGGLSDPDTLESYFQELLSGYPNDFHRFISNLRQKDTARLPRLEKRYLLYAARPINRDGYRSIEFDTLPTKKPKVLLLGDSFTWGLSAKPIYNSFPDLLAARGYAIFNSGIIGADPAQYLEISKKYIHRIKPDVVCVNFYALNDIMHFQRALKPYQLHYYPTNAGWLWACPKKEYLPNPQAAYQYYEEHYRIPTHLNKFNMWCSKTVLTTYAWKLLAMAAVIDGYSDEVVAYDRRNRGYYQEKSVAETYLQEIKKLSEMHGAKFLLAIIPDYESLEEKHSRLTDIESLDYKIPTQLERTDYNDHPDGHFNNNGHLKYADFLDKELRELLR